jgi:hypothetical protein
MLFAEDIAGSVRIDSSLNMHNQLIAAKFSRTGCFLKICHAEENQSAPCNIWNVHP